MNDDPLLGCRWKLQQAWRHLQSIDADVGAFLARDDVEPPAYLGVLVGDFLHNLRCVLDHLVWQLVLLNEQEPSYRHQFPITDKPGAFAGATDSLRGVATEHQALIEQFQPYHVDGGNPSQHMLAVLRDLSNIDKHRFVHPVLVIGDGDAREVRFTELAVNTETLGWMNRYVTYTVFDHCFAKLFPLPLHAVGNSG